MILGSFFGLVQDLCFMAHNYNIYVILHILLDHQKAILRFTVDLYRILLGQIPNLRLKAVEKCCGFL